ncbi:MAG: hypothetical protein HZB13_04070 [Acidobacteria bacterium]|nr:hypothetical protein [Acidobacteriota bacterium]
MKYGSPTNAVPLGLKRPPEEGARFDVLFDGSNTGAKVKGTVKGADCFHIRGDGRCQLHIHTEITSEAGM